MKCSERLPEHDTDVWIPCSEGVMEASFVNGTFCYCDQDEQEWLSLDTPEWWMARVIPSPPPPNQTAPLKAMR